MKYCGKCNKFYSEDKRYCSECGNVLIDKDKTKETFEGKKSIIEDLQTFGFEIFLERFIFPIVIVISIAELIFYWLEIAGLGHVREWLIKDYAGNSEMKTFGIPTTTFGDLEKALNWIYPVVTVLCIILCLRYSGDVLQLLVSPEHEENLSKLFDFTNWEKLPEQLNLVFYEELLTAVLKVIYKTKEWLILLRGIELFWDVVTVHREYDENRKIGSVWKNIKERILDYLP